MYVRTLILASGVVALTSASFNATSYVRGILASISYEMTANGETNWSADTEGITLEQGNDTTELNFFRAYLTGLDDVTTGDECTVSNKSAIVDVECLVAFPSLNFKAFGNLRVAKDPLVELSARLYSALYVVRVNRNGTVQSSSLIQGTEPYIGLTYQKDPTARRWEDRRDALVVSWIRSQFARLVREEISARLSTAVKINPLP